MHLWTPETHHWLQKVRNGGHPAGKFEPVLTYLVDQYRNDITGYNITQCVHVEANWAGDPVGETKFLEDIAKSNPEGYPQAIVGHADLSADNLEDVLERHCQSKRMRGIRQVLNHHPTKPIFGEQDHDNFLTDPKWLSGVALLEKYNLSLEMQVLPHQMKRSAEVAKKFPGVMFMVDHCGLPYERDEVKMKEWREGLTELSLYPNVYCKVSGMFFTNPSWDQDSVTSVVKPCLEIFGMDRCVFASNFPVDRINGTFGQLINALSVVLHSYSEEEKQKFFASNAKRFYRL